jgi:tRNA G37 N-methylase Trm5
MIKTVVNKLDSIDTKYRFFQMELLAGEPNYVVEHVSQVNLWRICHSRISHSTSQIAVSPSTSPKFIGIHDSTPSMIALFSSSNLLTSLRMYLLVWDLSLSLLPRGGARYLRTI